MGLKRIYYTDSYTCKIVDAIAKDYDFSVEFFKINNPTFSRWISKWKKNMSYNLIPEDSLIIGGNRWRHHFALHLTDLPIISIDAHTDMSYDEMIPLKLIRPYNWLYFKLLEGHETHLILPYSEFKGGRWNIIMPEKYVDEFHLHSVDRKKKKTEVSLSFSRSKTIEINDLEIYSLKIGMKKQISLDWDITREVPEEKIILLISKIFRKGDVCDIWLDEGRRDKRNSLMDHIGYCSKIVKAIQGVYEM